MAIVTAGAFGLKMYTINVSRLVAGDAFVRNATTISVANQGAVDTFTGQFSFDRDGNIADGVLTGIHETKGGVLGFNISGFSVPSSVLVQWLHDPNAADLTAKPYIFSGADSVLGSAFDDNLNGYAGADTIMAGTGNDVIFENSGSNYLRGEEGNDSITGGLDFDDINGNMGNDFLEGGPGADWVVGGKDDDELYGDNKGSYGVAYNDIVYGNMGNDTCDGGSGNDLIRGGQGNDSLVGWLGDDWLSGDRGDDTISGGLGFDTFHFFTGAGIDRVLDFEPGRDRIQLDPGSTYVVRQVGADVVVDLGSGDEMILVKQTAAHVSGAIFLL